MSTPYPKLTLVQYKQFLRKLGYQEITTRGKGSHSVWKHKKYLPLTIPHRKETDHYFWKNLEIAIYKEKNWILNELKKYKFL